jgi:hypothetical protein
VCFVLIIAGGTSEIAPYKVNTTKKRFTTIHCDSYLFMETTMCFLCEVRTEYLDVLKYPGS